MTESGSTNAAPSTVRPGELRDGYVFISYKREEVDRADRVRTLLEHHGFDVWWDQDIQCGQVWNEVLDEAVKDAGCIVVLWSEQSMQSRWVMHEASSAMDRNVYAPVWIELCKIAPPYNRIQATDVSDWDGDHEHPGIRDLIRLVENLLPKRKSLAARIRDACWDNRTSIVAILFAIVALAILVWQTIATNAQLDRLNEMMAQQEITSRTLDATSESVEGQMIKLGKLESDQTSITEQQTSMTGELASMTSEFSSITGELKTLAGANTSQLGKLEDMVAQQKETSDKLDEFRGQSAASVDSQLAGLRQLETQQNSITAELKTLALANTTLKNIRVVWKFDIAPPWGENLIELADAALDTKVADELYGDLTDKLNRMINRVIWIDDGVRPAVVALTKGDDKIDRLFSGDVEHVLNSTFDFEAHYLEYQGPSVELVMPLTIDGSETVLLNTESNFDYRAFDNWIADIDDNWSEYDPAFEASIDTHDGLEIAWDIDLAKAKPLQKPTTGNLPPVIELTAYHNEPASIRNQTVAEVWRRSDDLIKDTIRPWSQTSKMTVVVNGITNLAIEYTVTNLGVYEVSYTYANPNANPLDGDLWEDEDDYDRPKSYRYTKFRCER